MHWGKDREGHNVYGMPHCKPNMWLGTPSCRRHGKRSEVASFFPSLVHSRGEKELHSGNGMQRNTRNKHGKHVSNAIPLFATLNDHVTQTMPSPVALRRRLSWVPTPIALALAQRRVHWYWFGFGRWVDVLWDGEPPLAALT